MVSAFVKILDINTHKAKFAIDSHNAGGTKFVNTTTNRFWFSFVKLSDI
jgi:hypothetical protein